MSLSKTCTSCGIPTYVPFEKHSAASIVRAVHSERQMNPALIVVRNVAGKEPSQMIFAEDDVVQTLSSYAAVESFRIRVLPGTMRCREDFFDAHALDAPSKPIAMDFVAVAKEILRRGDPREGLNDLLCRPCRGRMSRYGEVNEPTTLPESGVSLRTRKEVDRIHRTETTFSNALRIVCVASESPCPASRR